MKEASIVLVGIAGVVLGVTAGYYSSRPGAQFYLAVPTAFYVPLYLHGRVLSVDGAAQTVTIEVADRYVSGSTTTRTLGYQTTTTVQSKPVPSVEQALRENLVGKAALLALTRRGDGALQILNIGTMPVE